MLAAARHKLSWTVEHYAKTKRVSSGSSAPASGAPAASGLPSAVALDQAICATPIAVAPVKREGGVTYVFSVSLHDSAMAEKWCSFLKRQALAIPALGPGIPDAPHMCLNVSVSCLGHPTALAHGGINNSLIRAFLCTGPIG